MNVPLYCTCHTSQHDEMAQCIHQLWFLLYAKTHWHTSCYGYNFIHTLSDPLKFFLVCAICQLEKNVMHKSTSKTYDPISNEKEKWKFIILTFLYQMSYD